jgi:hypothetical protein
VRAVSAGPRLFSCSVRLGGRTEALTPVRIVETRPVVENVVYAVCRADRTEVLSPALPQS